MIERDDVQAPADSRMVRALLAEHVPLTLLVDLMAPEATSTEILESEGLPDEAWWESDRSSAGQGA